MRKVTAPVVWLLRWFAPWFRSPVAPAIALVASALVAVVLANSALADHYFRLRDLPVPIGFGELTLEKPLVVWINDGLMALFFLLVGLEVKRELLTGHLSTLRKATLPIAAAFGGMVAPALIYLALVGDSARAGWGVPMATDIAFALGVLALLRGRVPVSLVVFLTAFAVADDIGAVLVIALFYTSKLSLIPLAVAGGAGVALLAMNRLGVRRVGAYLAVGAVMWFAVLKSGVHPTVAGLLTALAIPHGSTEHTPLLDLEHRLAPWVAWGVLPIFALANAGVSLGSSAAVLHPVAIAVAVGLVVGKLVGVSGMSWLAMRLGLAELPEGVGGLHMVGVSLLGGIGFTMAIFIANMAFTDPLLLETAKAGILMGSASAALLGAGVLLVAPART